ncbi:MAG: hypothetical protein J0H00_09425 [Burkholderiales bacterium]|nr:hypothetical protein [Burkholderiales bacterium]OJX09223.1 MAG: hypothetical protein BGO72_20280 [Burkholderiales bacterium 70-64]
MKRTVLAGWLCSLLAALGACDFVAQHELQPGRSTADDVRKLMGRPDMIWEESDGRQVLEYPRGPEGSETWMVEIDAGGRYQGMSDALTPANLARVQPGMSRDDLRRLLGKPGAEERFPARDETVWTWRVKGSVEATEMFHAHLGPDGRVVRTSRTPDPRLVNASS